MATRVLICEDESIIRIWLKRELTRRGFEVVGEARDGDAAVELAVRMAPDLIFMDIRMPGRDGISASAEIMTSSPAPIVILTAFGEDETVRRAMDAGVSGYLVKPVQQDQLEPAATLAMSRFQELMALKDQVTSLEDALAHRKTVDRAKAVLIRKLQIDEPSAHEMLQRLSSHQRLPLKTVAAQIIDSQGDLQELRPERAE